MHDKDIHAKVASSTTGKLHPTAARCTNLYCQVSSGSCQEQNLCDCASLHGGVNHKDSLLWLPNELRRNISQAG